MKINLKSLQVKEPAFWVMIVGLLWLVGSTVASWWKVGKGPGLLIVNAIVGAGVYYLARAEWKKCRPSSGG